MPFTERGSYAGMPWFFTTGTRVTPKALPTKPVPAPSTRPSGVPLPISSLRHRTTSLPSPHLMTPASMATANITGVSMESTPMSSMMLSHSAISSRSSMQQSAPKPQMVSYSKPEVRYLPSLSM